MIKIKKTRLFITFSVCSCLMEIISNTNCRKCRSANIVLVEYPHDHPEHFDGISEIQCLNCGARFGRWSGKELQPDESEKRFNKQRE